jgi:hypothetical protein
MTAQELYEMWRDMLLEEGSSEPGDGSEDLSPEEKAAWKALSRCMVKV